MAILIDKTLETGLEVLGAYCKIENVENLDKSQMIINIDYSKEKGMIPFLRERKAIQYNIEGVNPINQGYNFLKSSPEFEGYEDC